MLVMLLTSAGPLTLRESCLGLRRRLQITHLGFTLPPPPPFRFPRREGFPVPGDRPPPKAFPHLARRSARLARAPATLTSLDSVSKGLPPRAHLMPRC